GIGELGHPVGIAAGCRRLVAFLLCVIELGLSSRDHRFLRCVDSSLLVPLGLLHRIGALGGKLFGPFLSCVGAFASCLRRILFACFGVAPRLVDRLLLGGLSIVALADRLVP